MPRMHSTTTGGAAGNAPPVANAQRKSGLDLPAGSMGLHSLLKDLKSTSTPLKMKTEEVKQKEETSPPLISTVQTPQQPYVTGGKQMQSLAKMKVEKPIPVLTALPLKKEIPSLAPVQRNIPPPAPAKKDIPLPLAPKKVFHEPTCENGHRLAFKGKNDTQWACNGRETEEGCRRGCTDFGQSSTWDCWRCDACDFDLCDQCFADPPSFGWPTVPERTVESAAELSNDSVSHVAQPVVLRAAPPPPPMGQRSDPSVISLQTVPFAAPANLEPAERQRLERLDTENQKLQKQVEILEAVQMQLHQDLSKERENVEEQQKMLAQFEINSAHREEQAMQLASLVREVHERVELQEETLQRQAKELEIARSQIPAEPRVDNFIVNKSPQASSPTKDVNRSGISWIGEEEEEEEDEAAQMNARRQQQQQQEIERLHANNDALVARVHELEETLTARAREATESGVWKQQQLEVKDELETKMRGMARRLAEAEIRAEDAQVEAEGRKEKAVRRLKEELHRVRAEKARAESQLWAARGEIEKVRQEVWEVVTALDEAYVAAAREGVRLKHLQDDARLRELEIERQKQRVQSSEEDAMTVMSELQRTALDMKAFDRHHKALQNHLEEVQAAHAAELNKIRRERVEERGVYGSDRRETAAHCKVMARDLEAMRAEIAEMLEEKPIIGQHIVATEAVTPQVKRYVDSLCEDREEALRARREEARRREVAEAEVAALNERIRALDSPAGQRPRNGASPPGGVAGLMGPGVEPRELAGINLGLSPEDVSPGPVKSEKSVELENHVGRLLGMVKEQESEVRRVEGALASRIKAQAGKSSELDANQESSALKAQLEEMKAALQQAEKAQTKAWERAAEISKQLAAEKNRNQEMSVKLALASSSST